MPFADFKQRGKHRKQSQLRGMPQGLKPSDDLDLFAGTEVPAYQSEEFLFKL